MTSHLNIISEDIARARHVDDLRNADTYRTAATAVSYRREHRFVGFRRAVGCLIVGIGVRVIPADSTPADAESETPLTLAR